MSHTGVMRILILGAGGQFGQRLCRRLAFIPNIALLLNGRSAEKLTALRDELVHTNHNAKIEAVAFDVKRDFEALCNIISPISSSTWLGHSKIRITI